jgi:hypothetical protein
VCQLEHRLGDKKATPLGQGEFSLVSSTELSAKADLSKTVNVIRAAYMMLQNLLVMCCVATGRLGLGSGGVGGDIVDAQGNVEHWHMTPDNFTKIFEWVLEVNSMCSASTFLSLWSAACRRASDLMQENYCVGHSLLHVVQVEFNPRLICGGAPLRLMSDKPLAAEGHVEARESKELVRLQRELKSVKHDLENARSSVKRGREPPEANKRREVCRDFQKDGTCRRGKECRFLEGTHPGNFVFFLCHPNKVNYISIESPSLGDSKTAIIGANSGLEGIQIICQSWTLVMKTIHVGPIWCAIRMTPQH